VTFLSKTECSLCSEALEALDHIQKSIPCDLTVHKIDHDEQLFEKHRYEVPVVFIDGRKSFFGKIDPRSLERSLKIASRRKAD
jgi:glutaredoxin